MHLRHGRLARAYVGGFAVVFGATMVMTGAGDARAGEVAWQGKAQRTTKVGSKCQVEIEVVGVGIAPGAAIGLAAGSSAARKIGTCARVSDKLRPWYSSSDRRNVCIGTVGVACTKVTGKQLTLKGESCFPSTRVYVAIEDGKKCRIHLKVAGDKATAAKRCQPTDSLQFAGATVKASDFTFDGSGGATFVDGRTCNAVKDVHRTEQASACAAEAAWLKKQGKVALAANEQAPRGKCPRGVEPLRIHFWGNPHDCKAVRICSE